METLLFWTLPVLLTLLGLKRPMLTGWRLFLCMATSLYAGVWIAPAWYGLLDFLPPEVEPYRMGAAVAAGVFALFALLWETAKALAPGDDDLLIFPEAPARVLNVLFRFGFGVLLTTLLLTICCSTPLRMLVRNNGDGFESRVSSALLKFTSFADALAGASPAEARAETLRKFWYVPPKPEEEEDTKTQRGAKSAPAKVPGGKTSTMEKRSESSGRSSEPSAGNAGGVTEKRGSAPSGARTESL